MSDIEFKQSKICCISDIHLGVHQNNSSWHKILLDWAQWLNQQLQKNKIQDIMICGDLFHYRDEIAVNSLHVANEFFDILHQYNIIMITGNHDCYYKDNSLVNSLSILKGRPNITIIDQCHSTTIFDKNVTFCPWGTKINEIKIKSDIIFGHFELLNFKMNNFKVCDHGDSPDKILEKGNKVISGHFHLRDRRKYKNGEILYLGNPFEMDFGDAGSTKGWYELDFTSLQTTFHQNNISPKHIKVPLSDLIKHDGITDELKNIVKGNIIKLVIDKNIQADDLDIIMVCLNNLKPFSINVDYEINFNKFSVEGEVEYEYSGVDYETAITDFVSMLDINNKKDVIQYTIDLYKSCKE
mgnify:FL=1